MDSMHTNTDLELLAALLDGRLSGEERARAVKLLADSDEALELFASSVREQNAGTLGEQHAPEPKVVPISAAHPWRRWKGRILVPLAAAAVLASIMITRLVGSGGMGVLANEYAMELSRDPRFSGGLREGWEQRGWAVNRGVAVSRPPAGTPRAGGRVESKFAFRLGVRTVDLQVALGRGDTVLAGSLTNEIIEMLNAIGFSEAVAASYTELRSRLATDPLPRSIERASSAERELRDLLGASSSFAFGQWADAADLAAQAHNASFFESRYGTRSIRSMVPADSLGKDDTEALRSIDAHISQGLSDPALEGVHADLQKVIARRGS